jgi:phospholipid/cholesterol/gamma-HCH transport system permease protein
MNPFALIGRSTMNLLAHIGRLSVFTGTALAAIVAPPIYWKMIGQQIMRIGYFSLPVVGLTAFFTGGALALQIFLGGNRFGTEAVVPQIVVLGITRELGPVIAGLMVAAASPPPSPPKSAP